MKSRTALACAIFACLSFSGIVGADDSLPTIDAYRFTWTVCKQGDATLTIEKTQDTTTVRINGTVGDLSVAPSDAVAIGNALHGTDGEWSKLKGVGQKTDDKLDAGKSSVDFRYDPEVGFSVAIATESGDRVIIDRDAAKAFAGYLKRAPELAAMVDKKIQP